MESGGSSNNIDNGGKRMYMENLILTVPYSVFFATDLILRHMSY